MATTIRNEKLFCLNCGGEFVVKFPCSTDEFSKKAIAFDTLHKDCPKTWVEPTADLTKPLIERASWWYANEERGMSSETMYNCFLNQPQNRICHPHDPGDFKRCWKLLEAIPEWKNDLHKLKSLSPAWSNLVDNWDKLTEMYLENVRTEWKNLEEIGMHKLMYSLTEFKNK